MSKEEVEHFWRSFHKTRDIAMVALMLLNGLRLREVLGLKLEDLLFSEAQVHVRGKGGRERQLPLPPETVRLLKCYLHHERPLTNTPEVFVALKGPARGKPLKPAGLRSLFRHHRQASGVKKANPHRFRHYLPFRTMSGKVVLPVRNQREWLVLFMTQMHPTRHSSPCDEEAPARWTPSGLDNDTMTLLPICRLGWRTRRRAVRAPRRSAVPLHGFKRSARVLVACRCLGSLEDVGEPHLMSIRMGLYAIVYRPSVILPDIVRKGR